MEVDEPGLLAAPSVNRMDADETAGHIDVADFPHDWIEAETESTNSISSSDERDILQDELVLTPNPHDWETYCDSDADLHVQNSHDYCAHCIIDAMLY
jgi:hypothetical protein